MLRLELADAAGLAWAQRQVSAHHYLRRPVDTRSRPLAYQVVLFDRLVGCLIFGRPEATRCYAGGLTYGSRPDVAAGRARFDRWEVLNLARVWLARGVQWGGALCRPGLVPGFHDRRGVWRPRVASWCIEEALQCVGYDYLLHYPPVFPDEPYEVRAVLSYCDTALHKGTIYRAAGFTLARRNERGIETWWTETVAPLTSYEDDQVRKVAWQSPRGIHLRARRGSGAEQEAFAL